MNESEIRLLLEDLPELMIQNFESFEEESQRLLVDYLAELRINRISLYINGSITEIFTKMNKGFGQNRELFTCAFINIPINLQYINSWELEREIELEEDIHSLEIFSEIQIIIINYEEMICLVN